MPKRESLPINHGAAALVLTESFAYMGATIVSLLSDEASESLRVNCEGDGADGPTYEGGNDDISDLPEVLGKALTDGTTAFVVEFRGGKARSPRLGLDPMPERSLEPAAVDEADTVATFPADGASGEELADSLLPSLR